MATDQLQFYSEKDKYGEFSNFYAATLTLQLRPDLVVTAPTSEHLFQALKYLGPAATQREIEYAKIIVAQSTPYKSKILANRQIRGGYEWQLKLNDIIRRYADCHMRADWDVVRDNQMRLVCFQKFMQHPELVPLLLSTGSQILVEHTTRDNYWGDGGYYDVNPQLSRGRNQLGRILMETRHLFAPAAIQTEYYFAIHHMLVVNRSTHIDVAVLNSLSVNLLVDLSADRTLSQVILGQAQTEPILNYQGHIFVQGLESSALVHLILEALGKKYVILIYGTQEQYQVLIPMMYTQLYLIPLEVAQQIFERVSTAQD